MRRHHFLALHMLNPPADSVTLLASSETDKERRRTPQISTVSEKQVHRQQPHLFSGGPPALDSTREDDCENDDIEESGSGFLGRMTSYRRLMLAHTQNQMNSPSNGTLPSYSKTMHHFTLNQLKHQHQLSRSEASSPHIGTKLSVMPSKMSKELSKLSLDEMPPRPSNTPENGHRIEDVEGIDFRKLKRRCVTAPTVARDFAAVRSRDFAGAPAAAAVYSD